MLMVPTAFLQSAGRGRDNVYRNIADETSLHFAIGYTIIPVGPIIIGGDPGEVGVSCCPDSPRFNQIISNSNRSLFAYRIVNSEFQL